MNPYLETAISIASWFWNALVWVTGWILYPFKPIWYLVYILLLPFIHVGSALLAVVTYPARLFPGSLVETLYIYLSTAALIGLLTGAVLLFVQTLLHSILRLDPTQDPSNAAFQGYDRRPLDKPAKRSMADYRRSRQVRKETIRSTPLTEIDDLGYVSPKSAGLSAGIRSPDHISPISSPTLTDTQMKWARRSLLTQTSPGTILEEGSSDEYF